MHYALLCLSTRARLLSSLWNLNPISFPTEWPTMDNVTISLVLSSSFKLCNVTCVYKNIFVNKTKLYYHNSKYYLLYTYCKQCSALRFFRTLEHMYIFRFWFCKVPFLTRERKNWILPLPLWNSINNLTRNMKSITYVPSAIVITALHYRTVLQYTHTYFIDRIYR